MSRVVSPARTKRMSKDYCEVIARSAGKRRFVECGHLAACEFSFNLYGEELDPPPSALDQMYCGQCVMETLLFNCTRCVRCGYVIRPRDRVFLYPSLPGDEAWAARVRKNAYVIGCSRKACAHVPGLVAGTWSSQGLKPMTEDSLTSFEASFGTPLPKVA